MTIQTPEAPATGAGQGSEQPPADQQPKPTETVEFWKQKAREQEQRAKANAEAAQRLSQIEDSQKTEAERAAARVAELEQQAEQARTEALRYRIAARFGIGDEDAGLFLTGSDEATVTRQAERLQALNRQQPASQQPRPDLSQGAKPKGSEVTGKDAGLAEAQRRFGKKDSN